MSESNPWRPLNWIQAKTRGCVHCQGFPEAGLKPETCDTCPAEPMWCNKEFEAGANAILNALRETRSLPEIKAIIFGNQEV
ncbi:hypothetical protein LCGC14_2732470 [marine sediment metagenome]|uniref:Uncharacterized protein n=1 Tax=marine sediment metagenome TaxID=412755 RepID=A0A0F8Z6Y3_9ZZZZ